MAALVLIAATVAVPLRTAVVAEFTLYGALHAASLALSARAGPSLGRRALFVAAAAVLSACLARMGLHALHASGRLAGLMPLVGSHTLTLLAVFATTALGALAYGALIRAVFGAPLTAARLCIVSLGAAAAACAALVLCQRLHASSGPWLAIFWWFAFSGGLWAGFA